MSRVLHVSLFVNDLAKSIDFYTEKAGLTLLRGPVHYANNVDRAFVGHDWSAYLELVYELDPHPPYEHGSRLKHLALEVDGKMADVLDGLRAKGVKVIREPRQLDDGPVTAYIEDPDGITVELLESSR